MSFLKKRIQSGGTAHQGAAGPFRATEEARASIDADGIAFFHLSSGIIFRANRIGARIWQGVLDNQAAESIAREISCEYHVPLERAEHDTAAFILDLEAHGLLAGAKGI